MAHAYNSNTGSDRQKDSPVPGQAELQDLKGEMRGEAAQ